MPNWCNNTITLKGNEGDIEKFFEELPSKHCAAEEEFSFNAYLPIPEGMENSYDWCMDHWGVKWDTSDACIVDGKWIHFNTAWGPPLLFVKELSALYPGLEFTIDYEEEGAGFEGTFICEDGNVIKDECNEVKTGGVFSEGKVVNPGMDVKVHGYDGVHCFIGATEEYEEDMEEYEGLICEVALNCEEVIKVPVCHIEKYSI